MADFIHCGPKVIFRDSGKMTQKCVAAVCDIYPGDVQVWCEEIFLVWLVNFVFPTEV